MSGSGHIPDGMTAAEGINDGMDQINHVQYVIPYFVLGQIRPEGKPMQTADVIIDTTEPKAQNVLHVIKRHTVLHPTIALVET